MTLVHDKRLEEVQSEHSCSERFNADDSDSDHRLRVTVIYTSQEGTIAALKTAYDLARNLGLRVALMMIKVVPFHFPLDRPPVSVDFLERLQLAVVSESGIDAEEVSLELYLCRDRKQCLQSVLAPRALVVIGGRRDWRTPRQERKLEQLMLALGHHVIFVNLKSTSNFISELKISTWSLIRSLWRPTPIRGLAGEKMVNVLEVNPELHNRYGAPQ
jgi:hypothetical protein